MNSFAFLRTRKGKLSSISRLVKSTKKINSLIRSSEQEVRQHVAKKPSSKLTKDSHDEDFQITVANANGLQPAALNFDELEDTFGDNDETFNESGAFVDHEGENEMESMDAIVGDETITAQVEEIELEEGIRRIIILQTNSHPYILKEACIHLTLLWGSLVVDGYRMEENEKIKCVTVSPYFFTLLEPSGSNSPEPSEGVLLNHIMKHVQQEEQITLIQSKISKNLRGSVVLLAERAEATTLVSRAVQMVKSSRSAYIPRSRFFEIVPKASDKKFDYEQIKAWDEELENHLEITSSTVMMILGPANSGKSTLLKRLVNRLSSDRKFRSDSSTTHVIYVDLDPGQSEFSPPGVLTVTKVALNSSQPLFPVAFANALFNEPMFEVSVASTTPQSDPDAYARAIESIIKFLKTNFYKKLPTFVNTMGWISGLGRSLLVDAIKGIHPSDVIEIVDSNRRRSSKGGFKMFDPSRPCNVFSYASVTTPGAGWTAESQIPGSCALLAPYRYIQLRFCRSIERMAVVGQWTRSTQILSNFLVASDRFHFLGLGFTERLPLDLTKVHIYATHSRQRLPSNILPDILHLAWVQLAIGDIHPSQCTNFDTELPIKRVPSLSNNQVIGYGITFIQGLETPVHAQDTASLSDSDESELETTISQCKLMVLTHLEREELARVNLLIYCQGVSVSDRILRQANFYV